MKKFKTIFILIILMSCSADSKNPSGLNPDDMTEKEMYLHYGLEAPPEVYSFLYQKLMTNKVFEGICNEKVVSNFIAVEIGLNNGLVNYVNTSLSDYSLELDLLITKSLKGENVDFPFIEVQNGHYDFRLDVDKLCSGEDFSKTQPKDSTLKPQTELNQHLDKMKEYRIE
ncbi:hypothetical protein [Salibacter halophilus]|uniref:Uncharacterized protein n=1 Tax=Salibacter halophilus TaxID=1803916 RepID=A0A6N6MA87_9FLAO|nr:hypothetical protein [Salibacter halophilus]KAB1065909.1 hypothetical protein F3059_00100 [Salibacter halophilus]